ncbi:MAG: hypothetical protein WA824_12725 [Candidatus Sulfotelmatobacter sp.]
MRVGQLRASVPGAFTNTQQNDTWQVNVGGIHLNTWFYDNFGSEYGTNAVDAGVEIPSGSTILGAGGVYGVCVSNASYGATPGALNNCVGVTGQARSLANGTSIWGADFGAGDSTGQTGTNIIGNEIDIGVSGTPHSAYQWLLDNGVLTGTMPSAVPVNTVAMSLNYSGMIVMGTQTNALSPCWPTCSQFPLGVAITRCIVNGPGLQLDGVCWTGQCNSQSITMTGYDSGGSAPILTPSRRTTMGIYCF